MYQLLEITKIEDINLLEKYWVDINETTRRNNIEKIISGLDIQDKFINEKKELHSIYVNFWNLLRHNSKINEFRNIEKNIIKDIVFYFKSINNKYKNYFSIEIDNKKNNFIEDIKSKLNSNYDLYNYLELDSLIKDLNNIKTQAINIVNKIWKDLNSIDDIDRKINTYSYKSSHSLVWQTNSIISFNFIILSINNELKNSKESEFKQVFDNKKRDFERREREKRERLERERRATSRTSYSSLSSSRRSSSSYSGRSWWRSKF